MIYIVRVYDGENVYEYEYSNEQHAREHMAWEQCRTELYGWQAGREWLICGLKQTSAYHFKNPSEKAHEKLAFPQAKKCKSVDRTFF